MSRDLPADYLKGGSWWLTVVRMLPMLNEQSNTFAKHVLARAAAGLAVQKVKEKDCAPKPAKISASRPVTTYASVVLMMAMGASAANAASDGDVARWGSASTGHVGISMVIPERIEARGLHTIVPQPLTADLVVGEATGCIFGRGAKGYSVSVHAEGPYELSFAANDNARFSGAGALGCADGETNARLRLAMTNTKPSVAGTSVNTPPALTLLISPE